MVCRSSPINTITSSDQRHTSGDDDEDSDADGDDDLPPPRVVQSAVTIPSTSSFSPYRMFGVFWNIRDRVQELCLPNAGLRGRIPIAVTQLHHLKVLNLGDFRYSDGDDDGDGTVMMMMMMILMLIQRRKSPDWNHSN